MSSADGLLFYDSPPHAASSVSKKIGNTPARIIRFILVSEKLLEYMIDGGGVRIVPQT